MSERDLSRRVYGGLCPQCSYAKAVVSDRGSTFLLCRRSAEDPRFPRYPPQPIFTCAGFDSTVRDSPATPPPGGRCRDVPRDPAPREPDGNST